MAATTSDQATTANDAFVTVPGDRRSEVARTLAEPVQLVRHPLPDLTHGTWSGYWAATDTVVAVAVSFAPLAADYARHSRGPRAAFAGTLAGYSVTQVLCYVIGLLALVTVAHGNPDHIYAAFIALPLGSLGFAILVGGLARWVRREPGDQ